MDEYADDDGRGDRILCYYINDYVKAGGGGDDYDDDDEEDND